MSTGPGPSLEVRYAGILFRSKTEARWAFLFDQLEILWEYEPQGFDAGGTWYAPDFLLFPATGMLWAEVKGSWESPGIDKWRKFAAWRPQPSRCCLLVGTPAVGRAYRVLGGDDEYPWEDDREWRPCPSGHHFDLAFPGRFGGEPAGDGCAPCANDGDERLERAIRAARSYRFGIHDKPAA